MTELVCKRNDGDGLRRHVAVVEDRDETGVQTHPCAAVSLKA